MQASSLEFLTALVAAPSPSGYEQPVARLFRAYTTGFADKVTTDVAGNVTAALNPDAPMGVVLAGHMDEVRRSSKPSSNAQDTAPWAAGKASTA